MKMSRTTAEYVADRVDRMMLSIDKIMQSEMSDDDKRNEIGKMLTWHVGRTLNDQKSQMKFVMKKKIPELASTANLVIDSFSMHLLPFKSLNRTTDTESTTD